LKQRQAQAAHYERLHVQFGNMRLVVASVAAAMLWFAFVRRSISSWWLLAPFVVFLLLGIFHSRVLKKRACAERAAKVYEDGSARIEDRWAGRGETGQRFEDAHHVYAGDLDLFGSGSLFELLSTARTRMGESTLAAWLLTPATVPEILERQAAVRELRGRLDFRENVAIVGEDLRVGVHPEELLAWAEEEVPPPETWLRVVAPLLAAAMVAGAVLWSVKDIAGLLVAVLLVEAAIQFRFRKRIERVHRAEHAFADLELLSGLLVRIEREQFESPHLRSLKQSLESRHAQASEAIARLRRRIDLLMSRDNLILRVLDIPLLYSVQVVLAVEEWQRQHGASVRRWVETVGQMESLVSLGAYSYEHPEDPFPEFANEAACFEADALGHPLIAAASCVRNSVSLCGDRRVLLVSGSNMSGKSTLLRAVGIAVVMAMAGAPVRARALRLTALQVGASIRVNDSLREGSSRFYAEITRLRGIFDMAGASRPLLFLIDEMLQGTNSHDRRIGAEAMVRGLLEGGAIGLVTTHDLALTEIAGPFDGAVRNVHFQDELENGKIRFDYRLREGVVTKSNGLELMRSIGLKV
jgi:MutS domain V